MFCQQFKYFNITQIYNKFIKIKQYLQSIEKLFRLDSNFYYARNFEDYNKGNRFLYQQDNLFNTTKNTRKSIILITKIIVII